VTPHTDPDLPGPPPLRIRILIWLAAAAGVDTYALGLRDGRAYTGTSWGGEAGREACHEFLRDLVADYDGDGIRGGAS
jgi:hypothetical protein